MKIPNGYTEQEVIDIVERISSRLAQKFRFGFYTVEDIKQEAFIFAMDGIERYDDSRPLENFLWVHVRNRLYNLKRNNYVRPDKPCLRCPLNAYVNKKCTAYDNMMDCDIYESWHVRNMAKKSLMTNKQYNETQDYRHDDEKIIAKEIYDIVDKNIPINMRPDWLRFINGAKIPKAKREILKEKILEILEENGIEP